MKKSIRDILDLQEIDIRIRNLNIKLQTIPLERAKLVSDFEVVRKEYNSALTAVKKGEQRLRESECSAAGEQDKLKNLLVKSGTIKKQSEYEAVTAEIGSCKKRISDLETEQLELMDTLENLKEAAVKTERRYKATGRAAQAEVKELDALKLKVEEEIKERQVIATRMASCVSQSNLAQYRRLLSAGKGEPLSHVTENGLCSNCALKLPPATLLEASKGNIVNCDNCSYMLYDPNGKDIL